MENSDSFVNDIASDFLWKCYFIWMPALLYFKGCHFKAELLACILFGSQKAEVFRSKRYSKYM